MTLVWEYGLERVIIQVEDTYSKWLKNHSVEHAWSWDPDCGSCTRIWIMAVHIHAPPCPLLLSELLKWNSQPKNCRPLFNLAVGISYLECVYIRRDMFVQSWNIHPNSLKFIKVALLSQLEEIYNSTFFLARLIRLEEVWSKWIACVVLSDERCAERRRWHGVDTLWSSEYAGYCVHGFQIDGSKNLTSDCLVSKHWTCNICCTNVQRLAAQISCLQNSKSM